MSLSDPLAGFHPAVRAWFEGRFERATDAQVGGWPEILAGRDTLITAPTGSGKTLAAFLVAISRLMEEADAGTLEDETSVLYISPLKALGADIERNLEEPLREIGLSTDTRIRTAVRSGDTTQGERQKIIRKPPHILITTPESLYLMLTAARSREILRTVRTVIVDEIHALLRDKRGSHMALSLARLDHVANTRPARIGLSATIKPMDAAARFLVGARPTDAAAAPDVRIVDAGHRRPLDLGIRVPETDLEAVASHEQWGELHDRIADLVGQHQTTLIFVNTRRVAERTAQHLAERLGEEAVAAHHGSLSKDKRQALERRLKAGECRALVATASLELGIDVGSVDLVCQLESPRSVSTFLQRVGRSGHSLGKTPKGRLFPMSRDDLVECAALIAAIRAGRLDRVDPPVAPLDILAQQIVAEVACEPWREDELFALFRRAAPYAELDRKSFDDVIEMLSEGLSEKQGASRALLHRDRINGVLHPRRSARRVAIENGGAIADLADYRVLKEPEDTFVGTLDEDFAVEAMRGDIFLLGSTSWRILRVERGGVVRVEDARGAPPTIPFWRGEAPARTAELSAEVATLRRRLAEDLAKDDADLSWLEDEAGLDRASGEQLCRYVRAQHVATGVIPTQTDIVWERFFDESGGMQLVIHSPYGGRINRAFGLGLRKKFCRTFDFELQAAASDDAVLLSLGEQHSFPIERAFAFLSAGIIEETVRQTLLAAPIFGARWRWNAQRSLALRRQDKGRRVPPPIQRMRADDLLALVFPDAAGCQDNRVGPVELPDHPLVRQTVHDCLHEAMDVDGLVALFERVERGEVRFHARETTEPSPFAHEILNSKPYTYLDDAPLEERRARAVSLRRTLPESERDLGALDVAAIERVVAEAWPDPRDPEEVHDLLLGVVTLAEDGARGETLGSLVPTLETLAAFGRAARVRAGERVLWFAAESLRTVEALHSDGAIEPAITLPPALDGPPPSPSDAAYAVVRGHVELAGPTTVVELALRVALPEPTVEAALARLETEGAVLRGRFRAPGDEVVEFCDRRLLARIHRLTLDRLRAEIEPVSKRDFIRFVLRWQHLAPKTRRDGKRGVREVVTRLQGFEAPAVAWERDLLAARVEGFQPGWLDELSLAGEIAWGRLGFGVAGSEADAAESETDATERAETAEDDALDHATAAEPAPRRRTAPATRATPLSLVTRDDLAWIIAGVRAGERPAVPPPGVAADVLEALRRRGALFVNDIAREAGRLPAEVDQGLRELVARGLVHADGYGALRRLMDPARRRREAAVRRRWRRAGVPGGGLPSGRWSELAAESPVDADEARSGWRRFDEELVELWAEQLLTRWGVVFRDLLVRESVAIPWRDLARVYRRMEARGGIRGGRFVAGVYGEQFARPGAVEALRRIRREEPRGEIIRVSAADPANLVGILTGGPRVASSHRSFVVYRDGVPIDPSELPAEPRPGSIPGRWRPAGRR